MTKQRGLTIQTVQRQLPRLIMISVCCLVFSPSCTNKSEVYQPEEVPVSEKDPFYGPEIKGRLDEKGEWHETVLQLLQAGGENEPPLASTKTSMFNAAGPNPLLVRFNRDGRVEILLRLAALSGTGEEIDKKAQHLKPDADLIDKLYAALIAKKLDLRKAEDRAALIEEAVKMLGDNARTAGIRLYDGDWKLRYRWPGRPKTAG